jgi:hypothetical protein
MANVRKGLKRFYIVAVILWEVICVGLFAILSSSDVQVLPENKYLFLLAWMIGPPFIVYLLGFVAFPWIVKGFK